jgi:hypothetical protein
MTRELRDAPVPIDNLNAPHGLVFVPKHQDDQGGRSERHGAGGADGLWGRIDGDAQKSILRRCQGQLLETLLETVRSPRITFLMGYNTLKTHNTISQKHM